MKIIRTRLKPLSSPLEDLIPLIDLMFLLLLFFLLSSSFVHQAGYAVELPRVQDYSRSSAEKIVISLIHNEEKGEFLYINDSPLEWEKLGTVLSDLAYNRRRLAARSSGVKGTDAARRPMIVLRADKHASYEKIARILSIARTQDLDVFMAVEPDSQSNGGAAGINIKTQ